MKLRARWTGQLPTAGDYLMSQQRPRFAYKIISLHAHEPLFNPHLTDRHKIELIVEKVTLHAVPEDAVIHPWKWDPRTKTTEAWRG
jgi:hypothetical protein